jgi:hypothetical protein
MLCGMSLRTLTFCLLLFGFTGIVSAQHPVDPAQRFHRLICLVHLVGSGKTGDPVLPEYVSVPGSSATPSSSSAAPAPSGAPTGTAISPAMVVPRPGILAWSSQLTDDGKMVIVHYVAADRGAFASILADTRPEIRVFEIGVNSRNEIEKELRKYKKDFNLDELTLRVQ